MNTRGQSTTVIETRLNNYRNNKGVSFESGNNSVVFALIEMLNTSVTMFKFCSDHTTLKDPIYNIQCTLYTVHCTEYIVHCTSGVRCTVDELRPPFSSLIRE